MAPQEIKDKAAVIYDDLRRFAGADFEIILGCLSMVVACAECDLRFHNPEFSKEEIENCFNRRVSEISEFMDTPGILGVR